MATAEAFEALRIIEALRSGIPSRLVSSTFTQGEGREKILEQVDRVLTRAAEKFLADASVFQAEFGNGKSHLLNQVLDLAHKKNFVVSKVVLNKETPPSQLFPLFQKAARNCFLPEHELPGFDQELSRLHPQEQPVQDLLNYADTNLHPRLKVVLETYLKASEEYHEMLYGDLQGDFMSSQILKTIYRLTFGKAVRIPTFRKSDPEQIIQCFRFLTSLFCAMGYSGWVILFDEAELIQRHGPKGRIKAYLNLSRLMNLDRSLNIPLCCIFALASTYALFVHEKNDFEVLPQKAAEQMDQTAGKTVMKTIERFLDAESLPELSRQDYEEIAREVERLHSLAFGWEPTLNLEDLLQLGTVERRVRTMVRAMIQKLDLEFLNRPSDIDVEPLDEKPLEEDDSFFRTGKEDEEDLKDHPEE